MLEGIPDDVKDDNIEQKIKSLKSELETMKCEDACRGLDIEKLMQDMNSKEISDLIDLEYSQLTALRNAYPETEEFAAGVRLAVPKFFINGREPLGRSLDAFSTVIDEEIKK